MFHKYSLKLRINRCFLFILMLNANTIYANENYIDEDSLFDEVETVVGATRLKQKITKAPVSVTIIDSEMIEASGAVDLHDLLRFVPGFFPFSVSGNEIGVTSHFDANDLPSRLEVRIDGRSVYLAIFDTVDWVSLGIDVLDIDHIEVVRGTSAPVYGSNAFLGAINIVTKGSLLQKHQTTLRATVGSINTNNFTLNHSGNISDVEYFLSLNSQSNTGFTPFIEGPDPFFKNEDDRESLNIKLQGSYTPDILNNFTFDLGLGTNDIEIPSRTDPRGFSNRIHKTNHQSLKWVRGIGDNPSTYSLNRSYFELRDNLSYGFLSNLLGVSPEQIPFILPGQQDQEIFLDKNKGYSERIDFEYEKQFKSSEKLNVVFGVGTRKETVKSLFLLGDETQTQNTLRFFSNADYQVTDKANINFGFLFEKKESLMSVFSPRLALNYQLDETQTIRGSVAQGFHSPSQAINRANRAVRLEDGSLINVFQLSTDEIKPERIDSLELAYLRRWPEVGTQLDVKLFHERIGDIVTNTNMAFTDIDMSVNVFGNNGFLRNKGLELQLEHSFLSVPNLDMRLAYAYIDSEVRSQQAGTSFTFRNGIPKHSGTLMLNKKTKNDYRLSTILHYQSDAANNDEGIKRVDFNIGKKIDLSNSKTAKINLNIQNAFNHNKDFTSRNDKGMRTYLSLQLDF